MNGHHSQSSQVTIRNCHTVHRVCVRSLTDPPPSVTSSSHPAPRCDARMSFTACPLLYKVLLLPLLQHASLYISADSPAIHSLTSVHSRTAPSPSARATTLCLRLTAEQTFGRERVQRAVLVLLCKRHEPPKLKDVHLQVCSLNRNVSRVRNPYSRSAPLIAHQQRRAAHMAAQRFRCGVRRRFHFGHGPRGWHLR